MDQHHRDDGQRFISREEAERERLLRLAVRALRRLTKHLPEGAYATLLIFQGSEAFYVADDNEERCCNTCEAARLRQVAKTLERKSVEGN